MANYIKNESYRQALSMQQTLAAFSDAQNLLKSRQFYDAVIQMERYRNNIDYSRFEIWDNRPKTTPLISIIIVAYATNNDLVKCIKSIIKGSISNIEIIVVDNGKNEEVTTLLKNMPLIYVKAPINLLLSEGRNIGVYFARSKFAAFLDDDALASPTFAADILCAFSNDNILAIRGKVLPKTENAFKRTNDHYDLGEFPLASVINTEGCSAWKISHYIKENGMDPLLFGHEGTDLSTRFAKKYGLGSTIYWPSLYIFHDFAHSQEKLNTKESRHALMYEYLQWKNPYSSQVIHIYNAVKQKISHQNLTKNISGQHFSKHTRSESNDNFPQSVCLYIPTLGPGGAERQVVTLARELTKQKLSVQVLCDKLDDVHGHYLPLLVEENIPVLAVQQTKYLKLGITIAQNNSQQSSSITNLPVDHTAVLSLMGALASIQPDVLHCYLDNANALGGLAALCLNIPRIILSTRNTTPDRLPDLAHLEKWTLPVYKFLLQYPHVSIEANSSAGARDYADWLNISPKKITVTPNGIDSSIFPPICAKKRITVRDSLKISQTAPVIIWPGKYTTIKRPLDMLAIAKHVCRKIPEARFLAIGNPLAMTESMKEYIQKNNLTTSVLLLGRRNDLPELLNSADAMLLTSQEEGFPNALAEAMLAGLPVVSTSVGAVPDIVTHNKDGFIHEVGDIEGMANSLLKLICNPNLSKKMGHAGQQCIMNKFSPENLFNNAISLYKKYINKKN